ncbi:MAG TPA: DnaB-like helicase C-terminal domain-containing protein [Syntrophales bacterium]|nr:DnaB-like helicase C-terminal domain-containing protein [Syntrophales bacterium]
MTALEYIQSKGLEYRIQSGQAVLKTCPFCGDQKSHFYIDQTEGAFFCHKCSERGNLITLQKHYGDYQTKATRPPARPQGSVKAAFEDKRKPSTMPDEKKAIEAHERLLGDKDGLQYITEARGISIETVKAFKIGLQIDKAGGRWLSVPHYEKGKLVNIKSRSLPPAKKDFRRVKDCRSILFNGDAIETHGDEIYITEGEIDALTLLDQGIKNVIGTTTGAGSFDPSWIDQLQTVKKIILCYDPDEAGQKGAREAARRLGYDRCFTVVLPDGQDVNEYFRAGHDLFDFQSLVNQARQFDVAGIMTFADGLRKYREESQRPDRATGIRTGWADVDRIIKTGFMPGELVVLSAPPKIGKSTFALQIITSNALQDIPSLFFCLEMRPMKIIHKVLQCHNKSEGIGFAETEKARIDFKGKPLYLGYCYQKPTLDGIIETLKAAIKRYGLKLLCFDHLHFLCRSISNQVQEVGLAVQAFKFLAEELETPIILIAQPRKIQADSIMTAWDLKDSASIFSDCDHLIILHRARKASTGFAYKEGATLQTEAYDPVTMVRIEASRYNSGGECLLYYHGECSRFDATARA